MTKHTISLKFKEYIPFSIKIINNPGLAIEKIIFTCVWNIYSVKR
ncbi:MAG: hypothetical protein Q8O30_05315 [Candidatus Omnitrophota bacterium]|nr:hypothetical protein [Candidatus Omnitrophota bacterium]